MEIEKEIKQKAFQSPYHKVALNILFTASWLHANQNKLLKPYGISPQQYNILRILRGQHGNAVSLGLIQERMLDKMSNASRLVDKLVAKKLVTRKQCPEDRRQLEIMINENGLALLKGLDERVNASQDQLKGISEKDATQLSNLLDKMRG